MIPVTHADRSMSSGSLNVTPFFSPPPPCGVSTRRIAARVPSARAPARAPREVRAREPAHGRRQARARDRHRVSSAEHNLRGPRAAPCASRARDGRCLRRGRQRPAWRRSRGFLRLRAIAGFGIRASESRAADRARARSIRSRSRSRETVCPEFRRARRPAANPGRNSTAWDRFRRFPIARLAFAGSIRRFVIRETDDRSEPRTAEPRSAQQENASERQGRFGGRDSSKCPH